MIAGATRREVPPVERELDAARILDAVRAASFSGLVAGHDAIARRLDALLAKAEGDAYLLVGVFHDSGAQIDAFRSLVGPSGVAKPSLVAVEQLDGTGAWEGAAGLDQRGDDELLARYLGTGDGAALAELAAAQREHDYAAWKFGYVPAVMDLAVTARAAAVPLVGCDMPASLEEASHADRESGALSHLRELHCLHVVDAALARRASASPRRIAMLWGQAHVRPSGLARFLPPEALVLGVQIFGARGGDWTIESALAKKLALEAPVLVPLEERAFALLLPDERSRVEIDWVRRHRAEGDSGAPLEARSTSPGTLFLDGHPTSIGTSSVRLELTPGEHTYAFEAGGVVTIGTVSRDERSRVELAFDPPRRALAVRTSIPRPPETQGTPGRHRPSRSLQPIRDE